MSDLHINQATSIVAAQSDMPIEKARSLVREEAEGMYIDQDKMNDMIRTARVRNQSRKIQEQWSERDARSENSNDGVE